MKKLILLYLLFTIIIYQNSVSGQNFDISELEEKIDALIPKHVNDTTPGLVVGIAQNGKLIFSKGYGLSNLAYRIPNDPKMVYNIGSVSKQFLGYAFAMLHVKGELNIDDPVNKYLENWPEFEYAVTLRNLLTHTSGYREAYTTSILAGRMIGVDRLTKEECLEVVRKQPQLEFIPGSRHSYNSTVWVILAKVLEKVTGLSAEQWVENNILKPLQMNNTQIENYVGEVIHDAAESYVYDPDLGYINPKSNRAIFGAAEVYTSVEDLVKWINNYQTAEIGNREVNDLFFEPFILNDGTNSEYGLGIGNNYYRGLRRYRHTGGHEAFNTDLCYFPDYDLGIITISNYGGRGWLPTTKVADKLLENYLTKSENNNENEFDISLKKLKQFSGFYVDLNFNQMLNLTLVSDTLTIDDKTKLIPRSNNTFRINANNSQFQFDEVSEESIQLTVINRTKTVYNKVEKWIPDYEELSKFVGDYWSEELETFYHLKIKDEQLTIQHRWIGELTLKPIFKDFFQTDWDLFVKFIRDTNGDITGFNINSDRTLNVFFQKKTN